MTDILVNNAEVAAVAQKSLSLMSLIGQADIVVKLALLLLLVASIISWAIIFNKFIMFRQLKYISDKFEQNFWGGNSLDQLFERIKNRADHPLANIFLAAMNELNDSELDKKNDREYKINLKQRIKQLMFIAQNKESDKLGVRIEFLALVGSTSPFVGLFGTVWGIMDSFQSIAAAKNATLSVVAPGIAEALFATAIGLVVSIPAVIFFNLLSSKLNQIENRMAVFADELEVIIAREIDSGEK